MIVSQLNIFEAETPLPAPTDKVQNGDVSGFPGMGIVVSPADGQKCERCWMYSPSIGADSDYPDLCPRCLKVMKQQIQ
jgi:isoleucyl-tRNA synthetase